MHTQSQSVQAPSERAVPLSMRLAGQGIPSRNTPRNHTINSTSGTAAARKYTSFQASLRRRIRAQQSGSQTTVEATRRLPSSRASARCFSAWFSSRRQLGVDNFSCSGGRKIFSPRAFFCQRLASERVGHTGFAPKQRVHRRRDQEPIGCFSRLAASGEHRRALRWPS